MENSDEFYLNPWERTRSQLNRLFLAARSSLAFSGTPYTEQVQLPDVESWRSTLSPLAFAAMRRLETTYACPRWSLYLSLENYKKNLATLWILREMLGDTQFHATLAGARNAVDAGTQDFTRAPALAAFLRRYSPSLALTGVELDAFPPLAGVHSRFSIARHICRHLPNARFVAADFFLWKDCADFVSAFYPFVSPHPALAWGLPKEYGDARPWVSTIARTLRPNGIALVVHQGNWEEKEFDEARERLPNALELVSRRVLECPFFPQPHPMHVSLYKKGKAP